MATVESAFSPQVNKKPESRYCDWGGVQCDKHGAADLECLCCIMGAIREELEGIGESLSKMDSWSRAEESP